MSVKLGAGVQYDSGYTIHVFTESGTFIPQFTGTVEVLVVGGGGGGGMDMGGGGGGGGVISNTAYAVTANTAVTVTVGLGGKGGPAASAGITSPYGQPAGHQYQVSATSGGNSVFGTLTAIGGGYGGSSVFSYTPNYGQAGSGGSGGGASGYNNNGTAAGLLFGLGTAGQGNNGGGCGPAYYSGGGGGAGGAGTSGPSQAHGGDGVLNSILGVPYYWGAGGGGAAYSLGTGGNGGKGGGGGGAVGVTLGGTGGLNPGKPGGGGAPGSQTNTPGGDAGAQTGSGGGGGSHYNANNQGGSGGSGIVIVRYLTSLAAGTRGGTSSSGLIFSVDPGNPRSYVPSSGSQASLINTSTWTVSTGTVTGYSANGLAAENQRVYDTDPWGNSNIVWGTYATGDSGGDGGWNGSQCACDRTKMYRQSVWVRRTSVATAGTFYFGMQSSAGSCIELSGGGTQGNPYWDYRSPGAFVLNEWCLVVGHIFPEGWAGTTAHANSGIYTRALGPTSKYASLAGNIPADCKFTPGTTSISNRTYHYYSIDATVRLQFADPRIDLCDGSEPSINQLLNGGANTLIDTISGLKNNIINAPVLIHRKGLTFNGANYVDIPNNTLVSGLQPFTIESWFNSTGSSGRVIFGNYGPSYTAGLWFFCGGAYISGGSGISYFSDYPTRCLGLHHLVSTRDAAGNCVTYLDGGNSGIISGVNAASIPIGLNFRIGADVNGAGEAFTGDLYKVNVYNRVLSAAEVKQSFNSTRGRYGV
jgi:hypothetical protein